MEQKKGINFRMIWGIFMALIYVMLGLALIFTDIFNLDETLKLVIGVLFLGYATFRAISVFKYGK